MLKIIAERFQVPELLERFSSATQVVERVSAACGEKRNFGFVYHRPGEHQRPEECTQLVIPPFREGYEAHLFRQDIDSFLTNTAVHYGTTVKYHTSITGLSFDETGVTLASAAGETFRARYVADASGSKSVLSKLLGLREEPTRLRIQSRCLFTHMIDVHPYDDDLDLPRGVPRMPERWYAGTCHHIFDGGWLWVIPFNNREGWTNPAVSVGLSFDTRRHPKPADLSPEEEWREFLDRFPSIHAQFKDAKPIREWVSTGRMQYSCTHAFGDRFELLGAASGAGFIDALFSRGLATRVEVINAFVPRFLRALAADDFSADRFEYVERLQRNSMKNNDTLVTAAYTSFRDFDLWNAWFRVWVLGIGLGDLRLASAYRRYRATRDESVLPDAEEPMGLLFSNHEAYRQLFERAAAEVQAVEEGRLASGEAARRIFALLRDVAYSPPANRLWNPAKRYVHQGEFWTTVRTLGWLMTSAPPEMKRMGLGVLADWRGARTAVARAAEADNVAEVTDQEVGA